MSDQRVDKNEVIQDALDNLIDECIAAGYNKYPRSYVGVQNTKSAVLKLLSTRGQSARALRPLRKTRARKVMKVKIVGNWELLLIPENNHEVGILRKTNALGHVHFVCKAFVREKDKKHPCLLLTPSLIPWQRPKRGFSAVSRRRLDRTKEGKL